MSEEFCLSEKIENMKEGFEGCHTCDVKEFIRLLKEAIINHKKYATEMILLERINKLAGKSLI